MNTKRLPANTIRFHMIDNHGVSEEIMGWPAQKVIDTYGEQVARELSEEPQPVTNEALNAMKIEGLKMARAYLSDAEQRLTEVTEAQRKYVDAGKPEGMYEITWKIRIRKDAERLQEQWKMWRDLKKQYGL
ncbi:hypothetical protein ACFQS3_02565 [Glycomyces mayteni]|uniref:Uncharacterized protein n=1 Tax=Glycomyces mayteni TaxID=543887 RepID=A0ABW2D5B7_9ACTN|nr:hypothetical protein GCM10025732_48120 [Glycomyces mayteni]